MVPTHFVRMLALPDEVKAKYDVSSMKLMAHTGAKCPIDVKAAMIDWFGPVFNDAYGATEVGTVCSITSQEWLEHKGSVGRSIGQFTAVILDEEMHELAGRHRRPAVLPRRHRPRHRLPERRREDRRLQPRAGSVHARRDRVHGRRRLRVHHRPLQRHGGVRRRQHLPGRGRAAADRPPGRCRRRLHRRAPSGHGRDAHRAGDANRRGRAARPSRAVGVAARAAQPLQVPSRVPRGGRPAAQHDGQDQQTQAARRVARRRDSTGSPHPLSTHPRKA